VEHINLTRVRVGPDTEMQKKLAHSTVGEKYDVKNQKLRGTGASAREFGLWSHSPGPMESPGMGGRGRPM